MGRYVPDYEGHSTKRRRFDDEYRPNRARFPTTEVDSYRPRSSRNSSPKPRSNSSRPSYDSSNNVGPRPLRSSPPLQASSKSSTGASHTKKERLKNPSSRIHSIKNQLARGTLPPPVRIERERELASLLLEQEKSRLKTSQRKNLRRYHLVRFVERKKAERTLKRLRKELEIENAKEEPTLDAKAQKELERKIHEAEVDVSYTFYSPLGQKYISIFVDDEEDKHKRQDRENRGRNEANTNPQVYRILNDEQKAELKEVSDDSSNILRTADGSKPPMWYEVEKAMAIGQASLEALRDGKAGGVTVKKELVALGDRQAAETRHNKGVKRKPSWLDDDGVIDPKDLDSDSGPVGGVAIEDEDMSDGGFFER